MLSPSTRRIDRNEKRAIYAREGVSHLWFVDPDARVLEVFGLRGGGGHAGRRPALPVPGSGRGAEGPLF